MKIPEHRRTRARRIALAIALGLILALATGSVGSADKGQPRRDHGRGHWFDRTCADASPGFAACGSQVVTDANDVPLASGSPPSTAYGPAQFRGGYSLPAAASSPATIAIVDAYDDPNIASDLAAYDQAFGLSDLNAYPGASPWFRKVNQTGGTSYPASSSGWALEIALDVETAHAICPNCNILLVEASSNSFANLGAAENEAVTLGANVISNSWGGSESSGEASYDAYFNHPGVVITASTGDSGYGVEYPAASPYVVAVGGTTLSLNSGNTYAGESAWADGGSGCSQYESKPSVQTDSGCSKRAVADVSADADPNTGAAVYDSVPYSGQSGWFQVGGTSLASPLVAAVYALSGNTTNPLAPYGNPGGLHDVTSGSNGTCSPSYLCTAGPGYDGPTGLGTPNGLAAFAGAPAAPNFSLSVSPSSQTVNVGQNASYTVTMTPNSAFADSVGVTVGAPSAVTVTPACTLTKSVPSCTVTASSASAGSYTLSIVGTDPANTALTHSATASLQVNAPPAGNFSLSISPASRTLRTPGSTTYVITVNRLNGFTGGVTLAASGLPSGVTTAFSPNPTTSTSTSTLTVSATSRQSRRTYTFQVTGSAGSLTHSVSAQLSLR